jgi:hypothetical protein
MSKLESIKKQWHQRGFPLAYFPPYPPTKETACIVSSHSDIQYLLSIIEQAEKALILASKQIKDDNEDSAIEYGSWSENMEDSEVLKEVKAALKTIQGEG